MILTIHQYSRSTKYAVFCYDCLQYTMEGLNFNYFWTKIYSWAKFKRDWFSDPKRSGPALGGLLIALSRCKFHQIFQCFLPSSTYVIIKLLPLSVALPQKQSRWPSFFLFHYFKNNYASFQWQFYDQWRRNLYHTLLGHGGQGGETYTSRWTKGPRKKCGQDIFRPIGHSKFLKYK